MNDTWRGFMSEKVNERTFLVNFADLHGNIVESRKVKESDLFDGSYRIGASGIIHSVTEITEGLR